ncbi:MAG: contractile injection system tape measure protein, partial [Nitrospirota bacterium]|nr:contractile injection system tape measure protein [Nitrospirota bacterium]
FWEEMLRVSYAAQGPNTPPQLFWKDVLMRLTGCFQCSFDVLIDVLRQALSSSNAHVDSDIIKLFESLTLEQNTSDKSTLRVQKRRDQKSGDPQSKPLESVKDEEHGNQKQALPTLEDLEHSELSVSEDAIAEKPSIATSQHEVIMLRLYVLKQAGGFFEPLFAALSVLLNRLPTRLYPQLISTLASLNPAKIGIPAEDQQMKEALRQMLLAVLSQEGTLEKPIKACLLALVDHRSPNSPDFGSLDADECYLENAGLVILWPFLNHFFKHMDLLEKKGFKDRVSLHRAVLLLQYLATEEAQPAEYSLTLNRILCGMALETVFDPDTPISEEEALECRAFLEAVIAKVPILKSMSPEGFRGSFLLRKGVLNTRDGVWLLRVTRSDFDVVLDRFPWSIGWVKLPWMSLPLQVEW